MANTIESILTSLRSEYNQTKTRVGMIRDLAKSENRSLTADEQSEYLSLGERAVALRDQIARAEKIAADDEQADRLASQRMPNPGLPNVPQSRSEVQAGAGEFAAVKSGPANISWVQLHGAPVQADSPNEWRNNATGKPAALRAGQRWEEHSVVREEMAKHAERDRLLMGTHGSLAQMVRSLSTTGASAVVPLGWSNQVFDLLRNKSALMQANPTILPMAHKTEYFGRLTADVTNAAFRAESDTIVSGDPTFDQITLTAKTISGLCVMSLEFLQDASNANEIVQNSLAQALALKVDETALYGGLVTGSNNEGKNLVSPPNPTGLIKALETQASGNILGAAANGTAITAATPWNEVLDTYYQVELGNVTPTALLWNTKMAKKLAKTYTSTYEQLPLPRELAGLNRITSNQIVSYTQGTMTNIATDVFIGKFSEFLVGQRMGLELKVLDQRYAELGQIGIVAVMRLDFALAHPTAFAMYRALGGS